MIYEYIINKYQYVFEIFGERRKNRVSSLIKLFAIKIAQTSCVRDMADYMYTIQKLELVLQTKGSYLYAMSVAILVQPHKPFQA